MIEAKGINSTVEFDGEPITNQRSSATICGRSVKRIPLRQVQVIQPSTATGSMP